MNRISEAFPACAGMNQGQYLYPSGSGSVPRMRGDEPCAGVSSIGPFMRSPHARG